MTSDAEPSRRALAALAAMADDLTATTHWGDWHAEPGQAPHFMPCETLQRFVEMAQASGLLLPGFDWMGWRRTQQGQRLLVDPMAAASASPLDLARLVTTAIRADRFEDGFLAGCAERAVLSGAARRAGDMLAEGR